jgi:O-antigen biosynthesis protein
VNVVVRNLKRLKNIFRWVVSGDFGRLFRALVDQFWIRTAQARRFVRGHGLFRSFRERRLLNRLLAQRYGQDGTGPLKVALIVRDGRTYPKSSAFIRLIAPLSDPSLKSELTFKLYAENTTKIDEDTGVCIVQRTAYDTDAKAKALIAEVQRLGTRLIVDNDDAFHQIDETHPEHAEHAERIMALNHLVAAADGIWLSMPALKASYGVVKSKITVVQNSLDPRLWSAQPPNIAVKSGAPLQMLYMGTGTHDADFKLILPALDKLAAAYPDSFRLTIIGVGDDLPERPWVQRLHQPRNGSIYPRFVRWFLAQGPFDVGLAPLVDSDFNRGKSDIKCLDYLAAGIRPVVSDVLPYRAPELSKFIIRADNDDWFKTLADIVENPEKFRKDAAQILPEAQQYIWQKRSSHRTAAQIFKLLERLK